MKSTKTLVVSIFIIGILFLLFYMMNTKVIDDTEILDTVQILNDVEQKEDIQTIEEIQEKDDTQVIEKTNMLHTTVHPSIIEEYCESDDGRQLTVMKDSEGNIGAYIVSLPIADTPVTYIDPEGKQITSFYIFASPEENETPLKIIGDLEKKFPNTSIFICPNRLVS